MSNLPADDPRHGYNGYSNLGCRCSICRAANTDYNKSIRRVRARRIIADPSLRPHGVLSTYFNWACRCDECKAAHRDRETERRQARGGKVWGFLAGQDGAA
jgi:hypothetical protein